RPSGASVRRTPPSSRRPRAAPRSPSPSRRRWPDSSGSIGESQPQRPIFLEKYGHATYTRPVGSRPAMFIDRDGTLTEEVGYVNHPSRLRLLPRAAGLDDGRRQEQRSRSRAGRRRARGACADRLRSRRMGIPARGVSRRARSRRRRPPRRRRVGAGRTSGAGVSGVSARLRALADGFAGKTVVVIGDVITDEYLYGKPARISREAPVLTLP